ncbi:MAG: LuxR C-terminal-related transcriptional regulator [Thermomicrobiales bacterium]
MTNREIEVLRLVAMGLSDREVGDRLFISHGTARTHVRNILGKLGVHSRTAATSVALRERLIGPDR